MKTASWLLTLPLAGLFVFALAQIPAPGPSSPLTTHVESRYQQRSLPETGLSSPTWAVLADYRSLDLFVAAALFFTSALGLLLFHPPTARPLFFLPAFLCLGLGMFLGLGLGFLCLREGSNFLDYEALAHWVPASQARGAGSLVLLAAALLCLAGLVMAGIRHRGLEGSHGR